MAKENIHIKKQIKEEIISQKNKTESLMSKKQKKKCRTSSYFGRFLVVSGCVSVSALASFVDISSSAVGLKTCTLTVGITEV